MDTVQSQHGLQSEPPEPLGTGLASKRTKRQFGKKKARELSRESDRDHEAKIKIQVKEAGDETGDGLGR